MLSDIARALARPPMPAPDRASLSAEAVALRVRYYLGELDTLEAYLTLVAEHGLNEADIAARVAWELGTRAAVGDSRLASVVALVDDALAIDFSSESAAHQIGYLRSRLESIRFAARPVRGLR